MPSTYSPDLRIELIGNGEQTGIWGSTTNTNLGTLLEQSIAGITNLVVTSANQALIAYNGVEDEARSAALVITTTTAANFNIYIPPSPKLYAVRNNTSFTATIYASTALGNTTAAGTGVAIPTGVSVLIRTDGTNVVEQLNQVVGTLNVGGTLTAQANQVVGGSTSIAGSAYLGVSQTATITVATPAVITVASSPLNDTAVRFTTTSLLPAPLVATTTYYVINRTATTFQVSLTLGGSAVATNAFGSGTHTVTTVSLATTAAAGTNNTQLATTGFVTSAVSAGIGNIPVNLTNWSISEANTAQTATITIASPAVVTVASSPANGTAIAFTTTGALPTGLVAGTPYYVFNRTSTTYNITTTSGVSQSAVTPIASPGVVTVSASPSNGDVVIFSTTGALPTGITAGVQYYVINRTGTTFQIAATSGGTAINFTGAQSGFQTVTAYTLIATSGAQSGVHTEATSKMYFAYKGSNRMSLDLGGNSIVTANVTAFGTP
jgi:hypothetical protein